MKHFEIRNKQWGKTRVYTKPGAELNIALFVGLGGYLPKVLRYKEILVIFCNGLDSLYLFENNVPRQSPRELIFPSP